jgi:hypothetical protein
MAGVKQLGKWTLCRIYPDMLGIVGEGSIEDGLKCHNCTVGEETGPFSGHLRGGNGYTWKPLGGPEPHLSVCLKVQVCAVFFHTYTTIALRGMLSRTFET